MKKPYLWGVISALCLLAALFVCATVAPASADYVTKNWMGGGGALWHVGGTLEVASGGVVTIGGTDKTAALTASVTNPVKGASSGYLIQTGEVALSAGTASVTTGLASIASCTLTVKSATAPTTELVTYNTSGGTLSIYGWKSTNSSTTTLTATTGTETVGWSCRGA